MKRHTKIYMKFFGYDTSDFIPSEISGERAVDINHIDCKGMGGNPSGDKDVIGNLMALTREEHERFGDKTEFMDFLKEAHRHFMETNTPCYTETARFKKLAKEYLKNDDKFVLKWDYSKSVEV